jgi:hypothetical protein
MLWEDSRFPWSNMTNTQRKEALINEVFQTYHLNFVGHEPDRRQVIKEYRVRSDLFTCSDPRTGTDFFGVFDGEIFVKRGIGGIFNLGHPTFRAKFSSVLSTSREKGLHHLVFVSYHHGNSSSKGCAGHGHDDIKAKKYTHDLFAEMRTIFAQKEHVVPIMCGLNTDTGEVIFHGHDGSMLPSSSCHDKSEGEIHQILFSMFKGVSDDVLHYLRKLIRGNNTYMREVRPSSCPVLEDHNEFAIGYGEGFFPYPRGRVMVVNPFTYPFSKKSFLVDALRIQKGLQKKGVVRNGFIMASGAIYDRKEDIDWAIKESLGYIEIAMEVIQQYYPDLYDLASPLATIMNRETRELTVVPYK